MFIALVFLAHIYVDLIVSATNVFVVFLSTINKHFLLLLLLTMEWIPVGLRTRHHGLSKRVIKHHSCSGNLYITNKLNIIIILNTLINTSYICCNEYIYFDMPPEITPSPCAKCVCGSRLPMSNWSEMSGSLNNHQLIYWIPNSGSPHPAPHNMDSINRQNKSQI